MLWLDTMCCMKSHFYCQLPAGLFNTYSQPAAKQAVVMFSLSSLSAPLLSSWQIAAFVLVQTPLHMYSGADQPAGRPVQCHLAISAAVCLSGSRYAHKICIQTV
jgi:hypothetical protein